MKKKSSIKLNLTDSERNLLRAHKIRKGDLLEYAPDEIEVLLKTSFDRAREIYALVDFQRIPTIGIKFAEDLIFLGYYSVEELKGKKGTTLLDAYEKKKGYMTDPCVEDQFWLAVYFSETNDYSKKWWDFSKERKKHRLEAGYPKDRPEIIWTEVYYGKD